MVPVLLVQGPLGSHHNSPARDGMPSPNGDVLDFPDVLTYPYAGKTPPVGMTTTDRRRKARAPAMSPDNPNTQLKGQIDHLIVALKAKSAEVAQLKSHLDRALRSSFGSSRDDTPRHMTPGSPGSPLPAQEPSLAAMMPAFGGSPDSRGKVNLINEH